MSFRRRRALAFAGLLLLPAILLWPCLFGSRQFVPWDIAQFPPARTLMTDAEYAAVTENNNTDVTEIPVMFVPELRFILSELMAGRFPHWNPYARGGAPVWSSSILGLWYPINWLLFVADDPEDALAFGAFLSIAIAALLAFGLLTHLGLCMPAACFGALAFALSGTLTVNLHFYQRINALIWLPGMLWAISLLARRQGIERIPAAIGLGLCMFMTHTAGFPPYAIGTTLIAVAFTVHVLILSLRRSGAKPAQTLALTIAASAIGGLFMAAVQWVPMMAWLPESNRVVDIADNQIAAGGFDPAGLLGYVYPTLFTHPHVNSVDQLWDKFSPLFWYLFSRSSFEATVEIPAGTVFEPNLNFCEYTVFTGRLTLFLAAAGLLARGAPLRLFAAGTALCLLVLGSATEWVEYVLEALPFRWVPPSRFTGPICLFIAMLAAIGVHRLPDLRAGVRRWLWITATALGMLSLAIATWARSLTPDEMLQRLTPGLQAKYADRFPHVAAEDFAAKVQEFMSRGMPTAHEHLVHNLFTGGCWMLLCAALFFSLPYLQRRRHGMIGVQFAALGITAVELLGFGIPLNTGRVLHDRPLNKTAIHEFLRERRDEYSGSGGFSILRAHSAVDDGSVPLPAQLPPDTLLNEHIRDQQAYTFVDRRSHLPILKLYGPKQLARATWPLSIIDDQRLELPFWDMIGVRFILTENLLHHAGKRVGPLLSGPPGSANPTRFFGIYERPHPLPRAWVVHDFRDVGDDLDAMIELMTGDQFKPDRVVLLDGTTVTALESPTHDAGSPGNVRGVHFPVAEQTNDLTIEVAAGKAGYLVVNDTYMSGWTVTVNGEPARIHRANLFQRMVKVPASAAVVQFRYTTPGFYIGTALTALGWLALLCLGGYYLVSRRRLQNAENPV